MRLPSPPIPILFAAVLLAGCEGALAERPRHVILVTIDAIGANPLAGSVLDDLAARGTLFTNAIAPCGETLPSIATILTGRPPIETCAIRNEDLLPPAEHTLAEILQAAGFRAAAFTANPRLRHGSGLWQGFETLEAPEALEPLAPLETDASPERDEHILRSAEKWLASQDQVGGPPLFVWIHLAGTRVLEDRNLVGEFLSFCSGREAGQPVDLLSKSLLVLAAVPGREIRERGRASADSSSVHGPRLHVPVILRHPASIAGGKRIETLTALEDLAPTVLELLRLDAQETMHGHSLVHVLRGGLADPRPAFGMERDGTTTVAEAHWHLVWNAGSTHQGSKVVLFDTSADPGETTDLSSSQPEVVARLQDAISKWRGGLEPCEALRGMGHLGADK